MSHNAAAARRVVWRRRTQHKSPTNVEVKGHLLLLRLGLVSHAEDLLHALVHHVGDADGRHHFEEVGRDAAVQARQPLAGDDVSELAQHGQPGRGLAEG